MDTVTHVLLGSVAVHAATSTKKAEERTRHHVLLMAGGASAAFPDIDYLTFWVDPLLFLADWHRGLTHSFLMLPIWALLLAGIFWQLDQRRAPFRSLFVASAIGLTTHVLSDTLTVYGTRILAPLSDVHVSLGTTFVVDAVFTFIVVLGLMGIVVSRVKFVSITGARLSLALLCIYVAIQGALQRQALALAQEHVIRQSLAEATAHALPQPFSPFNWKLIITAKDRYDVAYVNLIRRSVANETSNNVRFLTRFFGPYKGKNTLEWMDKPILGSDEGARPDVSDVWFHENFEAFRRFARFPALYRIDNDMHVLCVWFTDLRYEMPFMSPPFRYGMCKNKNHSAWSLYRLRRFTDNTRHALVRPLFLH